MPPPGDSPGNDEGAPRQRPRSSSNVLVSATTSEGTSSCPVRACPTRAPWCPFHSPPWPRGFRATDRLIRQRPGDGERGGDR